MVSQREMRYVDRVLLMYDCFVVLGCFGFFFLYFKALKISVWIDSQTLQATQRYVITKHKT